MAVVMTTPQLPNIFELAASTAQVQSAHVTDSLDFDDVIAMAEKRLVQWGKERLQAAQFDAQQGFCDINTERNRMEQCEDELARVKELARAADALKEDSLQIGNTLSRSAHVSAVQAQTLTEVKEQLDAAANHIVREADQEKQAFAEQRNKAEALRNEVDSFLGLYKDRLGLIITRSAPHTVRMAFTQIDEAQPSLEFSFTLGLRMPDSDKEDSDVSSTCYRVSRCSPPVPELEELVARLNKSAGAEHSLAAFVCGMRRAFKRFAGSSKA